MGKATFWSGLRPMTSDGTPIIGATSIAGLFLNTGHGTLGWTMSTGSARLIAAIIDGRTRSKKLVVGVLLQLDGSDGGTGRSGLAWIAVAVAIHTELRSWRSSSLRMIY